MNTDRLFNVVLLELSMEKLKIEDTLEKVLSSNEDIAIKSSKIIGLIASLNTVESSIEKFNAMVSTDNKNEIK
jgi:hypothetical protein